MKYLKSFNENRVSIFDDNWSDLLPKSLKIITSNGDFDLSLSKEKSDLGHNVNISHLFNNIQITYHHSTYDNPEDCTDDGEPDFLCFDIDLVKNNDGDDSNPNTLKLNINITYGDAMMSDFSIEKPNKINVTHYNGINSLHDPKTKFSFDDESLNKLIDFFNRFGFETTSDDFKFLDKELDNYEYKNDINKSSLTDRSDVIDLKGGDMVNIKKYNQFVNENVDYVNAKMV
jgi:hypothetical protein